MNDRLTLTGKIGFEPEDKTKKHKAQASWKKVAMVFFDGEITNYYAWFFLRRYNLTLLPPQRGAHISFINDSHQDLSLNGTRTQEQIETVWEEVKNKWDGKKIEVVIDLNPNSDSHHWWFIVPHDERGLLQGIRTELGLGKPYFGMHMTIGIPHPFQIEHSIYIHQLIKNESND